MAKKQSEQTNPGAALHAARTRLGLTLAELAGRTGLPVSTLSKLENGKMALTFDKLTRLAEGLQIDIAELFAKADQAPAGRFGGRRSIARKGDGYAIESQHYGHLYPAADLLNKSFVPIIADLHARTLDEFGPLIRHAGEEYAYVLEGACELHTDLYAPTRLETGDSIYFDSGMGHAYLNAGDGPCRILSVCSASESHVMQTVSALEKPADPAAAAAKRPARRKT